MNRRRLLCGFFGGLAAAAAAPASTVAAGPSEAPAAARARRFRQALPSKPWLRTMEGLLADPTPVPQLEISGRLPRRLQGVLFRNGPAGFELGGHRAGHWFDGDGMVQRWGIDNGCVSHRAAFVRTNKFLAERDAGRPLYPGFASVVENPRPVARPDDLNVANISVLPVGDELWALWEAGSPWRLGAESLETLGMQRFDGRVGGLPFSAHPRLAPDGTIWNFGYASAARRLFFWQLDRSGALKRVRFLNVPSTGLPHDFIVTERHLVLLLPPLDLDSNKTAQTFLDAHLWRPERPTRVLVVKLEDLQTHFWTELPAQWVFLIGNGWEDADGVIRFDAASAPDPSAMFGAFRSIMAGENAIPDSPDARPLRYRIDTRTRRAEQTVFGDQSVEFPVVDPRRSTRRHRWLTMLSSQASAPAPHGGLTSLTRFDLESGALASYRYPDTELPEEHLFVPDPERSWESEGWVIGTSLDWSRRQTHLNVFQADAVGDGPIARATLDALMTQGLHGRWVEHAA